MQKLHLAINVAVAVITVAVVSGFWGWMLSLPMRRTGGIYKPRTATGKVALFLYQLVTLLIALASAYFVFYGLQWLGFQMLRKLGM